MEGDDTSTAEREALSGSVPGPLQETGIGGAIKIGIHSHVLGTHSPQATLPNSPQTGHRGSRIMYRSRLGQVPESAS